MQLGLELTSLITSGGPLPVATEIPAIIIVSGSNLIGDLLHASEGVWSNNPTTFSYQWFRDGLPIESAISSSYTIVASDAGTNLMVTVTATNANGSGFANSATFATAPITAPVESVSPVIGMFYLDVNPYWINSNPPAYTEAYQWQESFNATDWHDLSGETSTSLGLYTSGYYYRIAVVANNTYLNSLPAYSNSLLAP